VNYEILLIYRWERYIERRNRYIMEKIYNDLSEEVHFILISKLQLTRLTLLSRHSFKRLSTTVSRDLFRFCFVYFVVLSAAQSGGWRITISANPIWDRPSHATGVLRGFYRILPRDAAVILFSMQENASIIAQARDAPTCDDTPPRSNLVWNSVHAQRRQWIFNAAKDGGKQFNYAVR